MAGSNRPSYRAPSEPSLRRLGVGGGGGGRPIRAQLVIALVVGLVLLGVPLYLWRRPSGTENAIADAGRELDGGTLVDGAPGTAAGDGGGKGGERVRVGGAERVKCSSSPKVRGLTGYECDRLTFFEDALAKAIRENVDCAPKTGKEGTINYVLSVDFRSRYIMVFPGASGDWKGPQARRAANCVKRSLPAPDWKAIPHQYRYYLIAILATYPAPSASGPLFE